MIYRLISLHPEGFYIRRLLKSLLLLILLSYFPFPVLSQNPHQRTRIDSLKIALSNSADIERIKILNQLGYEYSHFNSDSSFFWVNDWNPDSAVLYAREAYDISMKMNFPHGMADALSTYSLIARDTDFLAAENYARQAVLIYKKINDERSGYRRSLFLGWYLCVLNRSDEAKVFYDSAIIYFLRVRDKKYLALAYELRADVGERGPLNQFYYMQKGDSIKNLLTGELDLNFTPPEVIAGFYLKAGEYQKALELYRKIALSAKSLNRLEEYYFDMFKIFVMMNNFDSARFYAQLAQKINSKSFHLNDIGITYLIQGNYNKALEYIMASLKNRKKAHDIGEVINDLAEIADIYDKQKKYSLSYKYAKELLLMSPHVNLRKYKMEASRISWSYFDHLGNTDSAYYYFRLYTAMNDSLRDDEFTRNMARYEMKSRDDQQRATIAMMNKQNRLNAGLLRSERIIRYVFIAILFAGGMLVVLSFRNAWLRKRKEQIQHLMEEVNQQLEQKNKEQKLSELEKQKYEFEMQALRAQMNPHFIFNSLNSINRFILQNNRDEASDYLIKFSKLMRLILQNSQTELIPLETEIETLKLYLDLEVLRYDHHIQYDIIIPNDQEIYSMMLPTLLLQPYVENAIWHGLRHKEEPGHLEIEISLENQTLNFKIRDDGIGREQAAKISGNSPYKSLGLQITAGRIAMFQRNSTQLSSVIINDLRHPDGTAAGTEVLIQIPAIYD